MKRHLFLLALLAACDDGGPVTPPVPPPGPTHDLVFEGYENDRAEMWRRDARTGTLHRVMPPDSVAQDPEPSPDGARIAFVVADYSAGEADIFVMNRDGSNIVQLTFDPEIDDQPAWSPDGTRIVFRSYAAGYDGDIWVMNADGSNKVRLTHDPLPGIWNEARPAWSPDGTRIAFASNAGGNMDIWTMDTSGADSLRLTTTIDFETEPAWSPDGSRIVFRRCGTGDGCELVTMSPAGGDEVVITRPGDQRMPVWTRDGKRIVFVEQLVPKTRPDIFSILPNGTEARPLVTSELANGSLNPAFLKR